ncbi:MAG: hypothetical protein HFE26_02235 [Clostridia bacterium]|nr:hypothetical protein [Clostridia bacterium]
MKFGKKSVVALALTACTVFSLAGCGGGDISEVYPEYADDKAIWIGGWDVPINTLEDYQMAKDMGLTHMFIDNAMAKKGTAEYYKQLEYCEQVGLKAILGSDTALSGAGIGSPENVAIDETDYTVYPAVEMINVWDEPGSDHFGEVATRIEKYYKLYGDLGKTAPTMYVNLDPAYHTSHQSFGQEENIRVYAEKFAEEVLTKVQGRKIISTDIYPLMASPDGSHFSVLSTWLANMETLKEVAVASDAEFMMFIQNYSESNRREVMSKEDLSFQIYTDMAFGINGFSYFTYRQSFLNFGGGCVSKDDSCTPFENYYWAKEINAEIAAFDHVFLAFDEWKGVMTVNGTNNLENDEEYNNASFILAHPVEMLDCATKVSATEDTIIGQFEDKDGRAGLMVVNFNDPLEHLEDTVSFEFKNANRALVYRNGVRKVYEVKDNKLSLTIDEGEGVFVIPLSL